MKMALLLCECPRPTAAAACKQCTPPTRKRGVSARDAHCRVTPDSRVGTDHGANQAHGLAFSVGRGVDVPPSLKNIYTELESDLAGTDKPFRRPKHGHLAAWARRGVLLLNASRTLASVSPCAPHTPRPVAARCTRLLTLAV